MSDIDDLFDYDAGLDEVLKNLPSAQDKETSETENNNNDADATKVLGLDADIKPTKQRAPIAKLDEARYVVLAIAACYMLIVYPLESLLSQKGIPKLRKDVRTKLKFKGKGHEVGSCSFLSLQPNVTNWPSLLVLRPGTPPQLLPTMARRSVSPRKIRRWSRHD